MDFTTSRGIWRSLMAAAIFLSLITAATAQVTHWRFQYRYGANGDDAARKGVKYIAGVNGGYIMVGETDSYGRDFNVYVVRTDRKGSIVWANVYDLGGKDFGFDIEPVRVDDTEDYVLTGVTENTNNACTRWDIFLMRINGADGLVQWAKTYGGLDIEAGYDVSRHSDGWVIAGETQSFGAETDAGAAVDVDGFVMRTDGNGNIEWGRTVGTKWDDLFYGVTVTGPNDILACGYTNSEVKQASLVRFNQFGVLQWAKTYGADGDESFRSVRTKDADIVLAGHTSSWGAGKFDVLVMRTAADGTAPSYRTFGTAENDEFGTDIQAPILGVDANNVIVSGIAWDNPNGFGKSDAYLIKTPRNLANAPIFSRVYGGLEEDEAWSVYPALSRGYALAGLTKSFNAVKSDAYLIRTDINGVSGALCNDEKADDKTSYKETEFTDWKPTVSRFRVQCDVTVTTLGVKDENVICKPDSIPNDTIIDEEEPEDPIPGDTLKDSMEIGSNFDPMFHSWGDKLTAALPSALPVKEERRSGNVRRNEKRPSFIRPMNQYVGP